MIELRKIIWILVCIFIIGNMQSTYAKDESHPNQPIVINEIMQSNIDCVMDDLNEFPDSWVELYNTTNDEIILCNYSLGISENSKESWKLPDLILRGKDYVLVFCDKESTGIHTSFRLDSGEGGSVYLFLNGKIVDKIENIKKQPAPNISYGRKDDGSEIWGYQYEASPSASNTGIICEGEHILGSPLFNIEGIVKADNDPIELILKIPDGTPENTIIRYTIDGSEPTHESPQYEKEIIINKTTAVRAKLFCEGWLSPQSICHSYIYHPRHITLPVVSITTNQAYLYDPQIGIYVEGEFKKGTPNYKYNWRRPVNIEYFIEEGRENVINQLGEMRISGYSSRGCPLKSMVIYSNRRFGSKRFNYEFFSDQKPGQKEFKSLLLRNGGTDFWYLYLRDAIAQSVMGLNSDIDWQAWAPAVIYINGEYKGIINIRERANEDNIYTNYNGLENIDVIENWNNVQEGSIDELQNFVAFYSDTNHTLDEYKNKMDIDEFINVMALNLYYNNMDFPGNNVEMWRERSDGGRWRWIVKDVDFSLGSRGDGPDYKTLEWLYNPNYDSNRNWKANDETATLLFRNLMDDKGFKKLFLERIFIYMGDFLNERGTRDVWDEMYRKIEYEFPYHKALYDLYNQGDVRDVYAEINEEINYTRDWVAKRTGFFYDHLSEFYQTGPLVSLTINKEIPSPENITVTFNDVILRYPIFDGKFLHDYQVFLTADEIGGGKICKWSVLKMTDSGSEYKEENGTTCQVSVDGCNSVAINAIIEDATGIRTVDNDFFIQRTDSSILIGNATNGIHISLYELNGFKVFEGKANNGHLLVPARKGQVYVLNINGKYMKIY